MLGRPATHHIKGRRWIPPAGKPWAWPCPQLGEGGGASLLTSPVLMGDVSYTLEIGLTKDQGRILMQRNVPLSILPARGEEELQLLFPPPPPRTRAL